MGRPIKKSFFGNLITPYQDHATGGKTGVGGEGLATLGTLTAGSGYSKGFSFVVGAPNITGGVQATITTVVGAYSGTRDVTSVAISNPGTGYTSKPSITATKPTTVTDMPVNYVPVSTWGWTNGSTGTTAVTTSSLSTGIYEGMNVTTNAAGVRASTKVVSVTGPVAGIYTINISTTASGILTTLIFTDGGTSAAIDSGTTVMTTNRTDSIAFASYLTTGTTGVTNGDILKQESSRRYLVRNSEGVGQCNLISTSTLTAGTMNIVATDWNGSTYYVKKLTARKAVLVQSTASTAFLVADGAATGWTLNSATGTVVSIAHTV